MDVKYECSFCGKNGRKLWKPLIKKEPLICAKCAEKRQTQIIYLQRAYAKIGDKYVVTGTKGKAILPKWKVDKNGQVPSYDEPSIEGTPKVMVDNLQITVKYENGKIKNYNMFPAVLNKKGGFYRYESIPDKDYDAWEELPTN